MGLKNLSFLISISLIIISFICACQSPTENIPLGLNERQAQQLSYFLKSHQIHVQPIQQKKEWFLQVRQDQSLLIWSFLQSNGLIQIKAKPIISQTQTTQWWMNQKDKSLVLKQKLHEDIEQLLLIKPEFNAFYVDIIETDHLLIYLKSLDQPQSASQKSTDQIIEEIKQTVLKVVPNLKIEVILDPIRMVRSAQESSKDLSQNHVDWMSWLTLVLSLIALLISMIGVMQWFGQKNKSK
jgi:type III secretory pathway lipoprotein EscJ